MGVKAGQRIPDHPNYFTEKAAVFSLVEFDLRYNERKVTDGERAKALPGIDGKRPMYTG